MARACRSSRPSATGSPSPRASSSEHPASTRILACRCRLKARSSRKDHPWISASMPTTPKPGHASTDCRDHQTSISVTRSAHAEPSNSPIRRRPSPRSRCPRLSRSAQKRHSTKVSPGNRWARTICDCPGHTRIPTRRECEPSNSCPANGCWARLESDTAICHSLTASARSTGQALARSCVPFCSKRRTAARLRESK